MLTLDHVEIRQDDFSLSADWSIAKSTLVAVIGPSGGGKSTLLMTIAGFIAPVWGCVLWDGKDLADMPPGKRPISVLFQDQNLFPHLTLAQNLGLGLDPGLRLSALDRKKVEAVLERVGLTGMGLRKPAQLSGGQQGRASLARTLLRAKPLLLLDEPFSALGPAMKAEMLDLVREVAQEAGTTVLMVTHDPEDVQGFAAQTILVANGVAAPPVATASLFANPPPALAEYLG